MNNPSRPHTIHHTASYIWSIHHLQYVWISSSHNILIITAVYFPGWSESLIKESGSHNLIYQSLSLSSQTAEILHHDSSRVTLHLMANTVLAFWCSGATHNGMKAMGPSCVIDDCRGLVGSKVLCPFCISQSIKIRGCGGV